MPGYQPSQCARAVAMKPPAAALLTPSLKLSRSAQAGAADGSAAPERDGVIAGPACGCLTAVLRCAGTEGGACGACDRLGRCFASQARRAAVFSSCVRLSTIGVDRRGGVGLLLAANAELETSDELDPPSRDRLGRCFASQARRAAVFSSCVRLSTIGVTTKRRLGAQ